MNLGEGGAQMKDNGYEQQAIAKSAITDRASSSKKAKRKGIIAFIGLALITASTGCMNADREPTGETESELGLTGGWYYDHGTTCVVSGISLHCCPQGFVMIGAHIGDNVFKCGQIDGTSGGRFAD